MGRCRIVTDNRAVVKREVRVGVEKALSKAAHEIEANAKFAAPVDTGFLRNSIKAIKAGPLKWRVAVFAEYALFVEMGTRRKGARPFLLPAFAIVVPRLRAAIRKIGK